MPAHHATSARRRLAAVGLAATLALLGACGDDDGGNVVADVLEDPSLPTQPAPLPSAAGAECVEAAGVPEAEGKPEVEMPVGEAPTELAITDITEGDGAEAALGDSITVQYVGIACSTGEQFDASWDRGEPTTFTLQEGALIQGWIDGIPGMKEGGRRQLVIPSDLAYGPEGNQGIAPDEALVFVIDLVEVGEPEAEGEVPPEGEAPPEGEGEGDGEGEAPPEGEGEAPAEGEAPG